MTIVLATTWNPRGELNRFQRLLPLLEEAYIGIAVVFPPVADKTAVAAVKELAVRAGGATEPGPEYPFQMVESPVWAWGRYLALQHALEIPATHIHYADFDRLLRWVETRPAEWRETLEAIQHSECLVVGRTEAAYATHPQALVQTEAISNAVISFLLGRSMDVSAGSKGFSRRAAEYVVKNSAPGHALGTDGEWPVLLSRAGFPVDYLAVDGLDWESADRYQDRAADAHSQRLAADAYDAVAENWARRVDVAMEIVECGLEVEARLS